MSNNDLNWIANFIWGIADDVQGESNIRRCLIENELVDCTVALPGQPFSSTQIHVCLW